jgi:hypothetical protein
MRAAAAVLLALALAALAAACGGNDEAAEEIPRVGDEGMRFGFNESFTAYGPEIAQMGAAGADVARRRLSWVEIEQNPDAFEWSDYDAIYDELLAEGMRPLWILVDAPCWSRVPDPACVDPGPGRAPGVEAAGDLASFLAAAAERYPESAGFEVGNEVNDERFWSGGVNPNDYAALLGPAADAIHAVDPEMPVLASGFAPFEEAGPGRLPWRFFVRSIVNAGVHERIDAFAFHPYPPSESTDVPAAVELELAAFEDYVARKAGAEIPVWVTEVGVSTVGPEARTPEQQALELVGILQRLAAHGTPITILHRLQDGEPGAVPGFPLEPGFGVVLADGVTRKPAYCAIAAERGRPC